MTTGTSTLYTTVNQKQGKLDILPYIENTQEYIESLSSVLLNESVNINVGQSIITKVSESKNQLDELLSLGQANLDLGQVTDNAEKLLKEAMKKISDLKTELLDILINIDQYNTDENEIELSLADSSSFDLDLHNYFYKQNSQNGLNSPKWCGDDGLFNDGFLSTIVSIGGENKQVTVKLPDISNGKIKNSKFEVFYGNCSAIDIASSNAQKIENEYFPLEFEVSAKVLNTKKVQKKDFWFEKFKKFKIKLEPNNITQDQAQKITNDIKNSLPNDYKDIIQNYISTNSGKLIENLKTYLKSSDNIPAEFLYLLESDPKFSEQYLTTLSSSIRDGNFGEYISDKILQNKTNVGEQEFKNSISSYFENLKTSIISEPIFAGYISHDDNANTFLKKFLNSSDTFELSIISGTHDTKNTKERIEQYKTNIMNQNMNGYDYSDAISCLDLQAYGDSLPKFDINTKYKKTIKLGNGQFCFLEFSIGKAEDGFQINFDIKDKTKSLLEDNILSDISNKTFENIQDIYQYMNDIVQKSNNVDIKRNIGQFQSAMTNNLLKSIISPVMKSKDILPFDYVNTNGDKILGSIKMTDLGGAESDMTIRYRKNTDTKYSYVRENEILGYNETQMTDIASSVHQAMITKTNSIKNSLNGFDGDRLYIPPAMIDGKSLEPVKLGYNKDGKELWLVGKTKRTLGIKKTEDGVDSWELLDEDGIWKKESEIGHKFGLMDNQNFLKKLASNFDNITNPETGSFPKLVKSLKHTGEKFVEFAGAILDMGRYSIDLFGGIGAYTTSYIGSKVNSFLNLFRKKKKNYGTIGKKEHENNLTVDADIKNRAIVDIGASAFNLTETQDGENKKYNITYNTLNLEGKSIQESKDLMRDTRKRAYYFKYEYRKQDIEKARARLIKEEIRPEKDKNQKRIKNLQELIWSLEEQQGAYNFYLKDLGQNKKGEHKGYHIISEMSSKLSHTGKSARGLLDNILRKQTIDTVYEFGAVGHSAYSTAVLTGDLLSSAKNSISDIANRNKKNKKMSKKYSDTTDFLMKNIPDGFQLGNSDSDADYQTTREIMLKKTYTDTLYQIFDNKVEKGDFDGFSKVEAWDHNKKTGGTEVVQNTDNRHNKGGYFVRKNDRIYCMRAGGVTRGGQTSIMSCELNIKNLERARVDKVGLEIIKGRYNLTDEQATNIIDKVFANLYELDSGVISSDLLNAFVSDSSYDSPIRNHSILPKNGTDRQNISLSNEFDVSLLGKFTETINTDGRNGKHIAPLGATLPVIQDPLYNSPIGTATYTPETITVGALTKPSNTVSPETINKTNLSRAIPRLEIEDNDAQKLKLHIMKDNSGSMGNLIDIQETAINSIKSDLLDIENKFKTSGVYAGYPKHTEIVLGDGTGDDGLDIPNKPPLHNFDRVIDQVDAVISDYDTTKKEIVIMTLDGGKVADGPRLKAKIDQLKFIGAEVYLGWIGYGGNVAQMAQAAKDLFNQSDSVFNVFGKNNVLPINTDTAAEELVGLVNIAISGKKLSDGKKDNSLSSVDALYNKKFDGTNTTINYSKRDGSETITEVRKGNGDTGTLVSQEVDKTSGSQIIAKELVYESVGMLGTNKLKKQYEKVTDSGNITKQIDEEYTNGVLTRCDNIIVSGTTKTKTTLNSKKWEESIYTNGTISSKKTEETFTDGSIKTEEYIYDAVGSEIEYKIETKKLSKLIGNSIRTSDLDITQTFDDSGNIRSIKGKKKSTNEEYDIVDGNGTIKTKIGSNSIIKEIVNDIVDNIAISDASSKLTTFKTSGGISQIGSFDLNSINLQEFITNNVITEDNILSAIGSDQHREMKKVISGGDIKKIKVDNRGRVVELGLDRSNTADIDLSGLPHLKKIYLEDVPNEIFLSASRSSYYEFDILGKNKFVDISDMPHEIQNNLMYSKGTLTQK